MITSNKPIHKLEDFRGLKMRIQSSKVLEATYRSLGALPQVLAFSEVYQALQTGVVDGGENTPSNVYTQKFHEVQKYLTVSDNTYIGYALIVNKKFWEGLPPDIRTTLEGAVKEATAYCNSIAEQENREALAKIKASGNGRILRRSPPRRRPSGARRLLKVHERDGAAHRQGPARGDLQGDGGQRDAVTCAAIAATPIGALMFKLPLRILDRLEEVLIASLMAAATVITFVAVVHRYLSTIPALQRLHHPDRHDWAQELCIYMFIWVAKFGAAYGVRTGIHVGVDVLINRLKPGAARRRHHLRPALRRALHRDHRLSRRRTSCGRSDRPTRRPPTWRCRCGSSIWRSRCGSFLMCFRFLQVAWHFARTGDLPRDITTARLEGVDVPSPDEAA